LTQIKARAYLARVSTTSERRTLSRTTRIFADQWAAAEEYAAQQEPPARVDDIVRWWMDMGIEAHKQRQAKKAQADAQ
jgi:hypothetical protein